MLPAGGLELAPALRYKGSEGRGIMVFFPYSVLLAVPCCRRKHAWEQDPCSLKGFHGVIIGRIRLFCQMMVQLQQHLSG